MILHIKNNGTGHESVFDLEKAAERESLFSEYDTVKHFFEKYPREEAVQHTLSFLSSHWGTAWVSRTLTKREVENHWLGTESPQKADVVELRDRLKKATKIE